MALDVLPLGAEHVGEAAALCARQYGAERQAVPALPARYEQAAEIIPRLSSLTSKRPTVGAFADGRLVGFLGGWLLPNWRGRRAVFCPEWAQAASGAQRRRIYEAMYSYLAPLWVDDGCLCHLVCLLAHDSEALETWRWLSFAMTAADAVRDLSSVTAYPPAAVRRAGEGDASLSLQLAGDLRAYLSGSPTYLPLGAADSLDSHRQWLAQNANCLLVAERNGAVVAGMRIGPANSDACAIIKDEKTASITLAYTQPQARHDGLGAALLARAIAWAREQGYERCAVDFEPHNPLGARFWLRHFEPVCYSLVRHVDATASANARGAP